jgi:hypothetical protein
MAKAKKSATLHTTRTQFRYVNRFKGIGTDLILIALATMLATIFLFVSPMLGEFTAQHPTIVICIGILTPIMFIWTLALFYSWLRCDKVLLTFGDSAEGSELLLRGGDVAHLPKAQRESVILAQQNHLAKLYAAARR